MVIAHPVAGGEAQPDGAGALRGGAGRLDAERKADRCAVKNDPPIVLVSTVPSMLILVDGEPVYRDVKATSLTRV